MTSLAIVLFLSWVSAAAETQDLNQRLRTYAESGQAETLRGLLAGTEHVDVDSRGEGGWTALMYAAKAGHVAVIRVLLDGGADANLGNDVEETALHIAAKNGRAVAVQLLLEAGADFTARDAGGRTPLYRAIERRHADAIELLQAAAQAAADRRGRVEETPVEERTLPPKIVESAPAPYTDIALKQGIEGTVVVMALIRRDGTLGGLSVSKGLEESLDRRALDTVRGWKFEPATREGVPVDAILEIQLDFKLPKKR